MKPSKSSIVVGVILAGLLFVAAPRSAQAQCYSYLSSPGYIVTPGYVGSSVYVAPAPVYVAPRAAYYTYPSYAGYRTYPAYTTYRGYYGGHHKRYHHHRRPYYRGSSVGFSFGYHHR